VDKPVPTWFNDAQCKVDIILDKLEYSGNFSLKNTLQNISNVSTEFNRHYLQILMIDG